MSKKYVIDLPDDAQYILINGASENHCYTRVEQVDDLEELNSDYINEHYGQMQDEAYQRGLEDGKWKAEDGCDGCKYFEDTSLTNPCSECTRAWKDHYTPAPPSDRIEVGDEVISLRKNGEVIEDISPWIVTYETKYAYQGFDACGMFHNNPKEKVRKTGKHYDIASILEAMRTHD